MPVMPSTSLIKGVDESAGSGTPSDGDTPTPPCEPNLILGILKRPKG